MNNKITEFKGDYYFLSNFYPHKLTLYGKTYQNAEAAFHAQKTFDLSVKSQFQNLPPNEAKRLGRQIKLREDWEEIKVEVMEHVIRAKFSEPDLQDMLLDTGDAILIEGNTWGDKFWGVCDGNGLNMLGKTIMKVRNELKGY